MKENVDQLLVSLHMAELRSLHTTSGLKDTKSCSLLPFRSGSRTNLWVGVLEDFFNMSRCICVGILELV